MKLVYGEKGLTFPDAPDRLAHVVLLDSRQCLHSREGRWRGKGRTVGPLEGSGDDLEDLEFSRIGSVEAEEVEEVVCNKLSRY